MFNYPQKRIALTLAAVGACLGLAVLVLEHIGITARWMVLPAPPEPATRILAASYRGVWIEARFGNRYALATQYQEYGWSQSDMTNAPTVEKQPRLSEGVWVPPLQGVISTYDIQAKIGNNLYHSRYAVVNSGEVYYWQYHIYPLVSLRLVIYPFVGAFSVLFVGFLFINLRWPPSHVKVGSSTEEVTSELLRSPRHPLGW
jgi:hypothetical protein